jgi:hypothetical protein
MTFQVKYEWVDNLSKKQFLANSMESVRVMGVLTAIDELRMEDRPLMGPFTMMMGAAYMGLGGDDDGIDMENFEDEAVVASSLRQITIEDGTGTVSVWAPQQMLDNLGLDEVIGKTFDFCLKLRQTGTTKRWFMKLLILVENSAEEQHRWILLSHQDRHHSGRNGNPPPHNHNLAPTYSHKFGFPTRRRDMSEVFRLIRVNAQMQQKRQQLKAKRSWTRTQQRMRKGAASTANTAPLNGISLERLASVLQTPKETLKKMIEELQWDGRIYQNAKGDYLPL